MPDTAQAYARFGAAHDLVSAEPTAYLQIAVEDSAEDPTAVVRALGEIARPGKMSELARRVGMSRDSLYRALSERGNPTWSTMLKVSRALGLKVTFHPVSQPHELGLGRVDKASSGGWSYAPAATDAT